MQETIMYILTFAHEDTFLVCVYYGVILSFAIAGTMGFKKVQKESFTLNNIPLPIVTIAYILISFGFIWFITSQIIRH